MGSATTPLRCYLVEWYCSGLDQTRVERIVADLDRSSNTAVVEGSRVRRVLILAVPDDDVIFGIFEAHSSVAVELVCVEAGLAADRITAAVADCPGPQA